MNFPKIEKDQIAILYTERSTGIVLNIDLKHNANSSKFEYVVFNSLGEAKTHCFQKIKEFSNIECNLYDSTNKEIMVIDIETI